MPNQRKLEERAEKYRQEYIAALERANAARETMEGKQGRQRKRAYNQADKLAKKAAEAKNAYKLAAGRADGSISKDEESRQFWSRVRHRGYDFVKFFVDKFRASNACTNLDHQVEHDGHNLVNQGRIYLGGTKPMFEYQDAAQPDKKYLFKEAITCVGTEKPEGAHVCAAAYQLQKAINPSSAIETFTQMDGGRVLGSFQEKVNVDGNAQDLFEWQNRPEGQRGAIEEHLKPQILREHTVDWLIGNFDTKGENFVIDTDGHIRGIDKEQAFSFLEAEGAQHMSRTYQPNPNNTLYNVMFSEFAAGRMELDLQEVCQTIGRVERLGREEYLGMFDQALEAKSKGDAAKKARLADRMMERKEGLREEYRTFFQGLIEERYPVNTPDAERNAQNQSRRDEYLDAQGGFVFRDEPERMTVKQQRETAAMRENTVDHEVQREAVQPVRERLTAEEIREFTGRTQEERMPRTRTEAAPGRQKNREKGR